jgi:hypothetical protein
MLVPHIKAKIDSAGEITHDYTRAELTKFVDAIASVLE